MVIDPTYLGTVQDVEGATLRVLLDSSTGSGLLFVDGHPYRVGQVGSFVKVPLGFTNLLGIVSQAGADDLHDEPPEGHGPGRRWLRVQLIGESNDKEGFSRGVSLLPSIGDRAHVVTAEHLSIVYGTVESRERIRIGRIASAESIPALIDINALVTRHCSVVGTTGSGKSTTVASILRAITDPMRYPSARVMLFDVHGEYSTALGDRADVFQTSRTRNSVRPLVVPYWALSFEELIPLSFGALSDDPAKGAIRDEIVRLKRDALNVHPRAGITPERVTVDTPIPFSIHSLWLQLHKLVNATHTQSTNQTADTEALEMDEHGDAVQPGDALAVVPPLYRSATQAAGEVKIYLSSSTLNIRRQVDALGSQLRDPRFGFLFSPGDWAPDHAGSVRADLDEWLRQWIGGEKTAVILDLSGIPTSVLGVIVGALIRILYDALFWARWLSEGGRERPCLFVFEEAHAYVSEARAPLAAAAIQRVVKEGRKYGVGAMIVSQRPSEIDSTVLSQCGTIIALRLSNSTDRNHIEGAVSDNLSGLVAMLPVLRTGEAIVLGEAVPLPMRALIDRPGSLPDSTDPKVSGSSSIGGWDKSREPSDYSDVVERWRSQDPRSRRVIE